MFHKHDFNYSIKVNTFSNLHMHLGGSLYMNLPIKNWKLKEYIAFSDYWHEQLKRKKVDLIAWETAACMSLALSLQNGVTNIGTILGSDLFSKFHLRNSYIGYPIMKSQKLSSYILDAEEAYQNFRTVNINLGLQSGVFFHSLYTNDEESLNLTKRLLKKYPKDFLQIHCAEDEYTLSKTKKLWGKGPIQILNDNGLLNENTFIIHGCLLSEDDLELIGEKKAKVIICPISNMRVGQLPLNPKLLSKYKIEWFIGSDGLGTGSTMNLRCQAYILKQVYPEITFLELWNAITQLPKNFKKNNNDFCIFELNKKIKDLSYVFEILITNYDIMPKSVCMDKKMYHFSNGLYDISKYEPTIDDWKNWKRKEGLYG